MKMPEVIYVTKRVMVEGEDFDAHTSADSIDQFDDGELVGVYRLEQVRKFECRKTLVETPAGDGKRGKRK